MSIIENADIQHLLNQIHHCNSEEEYDDIEDDIYEAHEYGEITENELDELIKMHKEKNGYLITYDDIVVDGMCLTDPNLDDNF